MAGFGGAVKLTGESEYKKALTQISQSLKVVSAEMKATSSSFEAGEKSQSQLATSAKELKASLETQKSALSTLKNQLSQMTSQNNAWSAEQVQKQMNFQEYMSNTAHQREVADLKAAGLNPILSASSSGASTPSGNAATADNSAVSAISSILGTVLETENAKAIADKNNSAAALRQQASDRAEMDRLVYSAEPEP